MELWDAYDENFNIINGVTLVSAEEFKAFSKGSLATTRIQAFIEELKE